MANASINGIYAVYLTGRSTQGLAMLVFRNGEVAGVDVGGVRYDGTYNANETGFAIRLKVAIPPNVALVQGVTVGPQGDNSELDFQLPMDFLSLPFIRVAAKHGPVNAKIVRLRELDD